MHFSGVVDRYSEKNCVGQTGLWLLSSGFWVISEYDSTVVYATYIDISSILC